MSKFLIEGNVLIITRELAEKVGLNEAHVLQQLHYWLERSKNEAEGHYWVYNSYSDWQKQFPFFSERTIRRVFKKLEDEGYVISGNYNKMAMDKTKWYRINYDLLNMSDSEGHIDQTKRTKWTHTDTDKMDTQDADKMDRAIPLDYQETTYHKNTTNNNTSIKTIKKENDLAAFQQFWTMYPKKVDKKKAEKSFSSVTKLYPIEDILAGTKRYVQQLEKMRTERQYIKHPSTFLNNHSFLNDYEGANDEINKRKYSEEYNLPF